MSNGFSVASWKQYNGMQMMHGPGGSSQYGRDEMSSKESARRHSGSFS